MKKSLFTLTLLAAATVAQADDLKFHVYNPQGESMFPVTSTIVEGDKEILLVDAQFQRNDAEKLVKQIQSLNKPLKTIYISHSDPDYYFGLDVLTQAFPDAQVIATPETVKAIKGNVIAKVDYWSPLMAENAPKAIVLPKASEQKSLKVGSSEIAIKGQDIDPKHIYLWDEASKTLFGGVRLYEGMHVWLADTATKQSRQNWFKQLEQMEKLQPKTVIAGHYLGKSDAEGIAFDKGYLQQTEKALSKAKNSKQFIAAMEKAYPNLEGKSDLELGAKVLTGEMKW